MAKRNAPKQTNPKANDYREKLISGSLIQDVRDYFLRSVRENGMKTPWSKMSEGEQTLEIERAENRAEALVRDILNLVAEGEFRAVPAVVDNFKIKGEGVVIQIKALRDDDNLLALNHAGSQAVSLVIVDIEQFDQHRTALKADPDEPGLPGIKAEIQPEDVQPEPPAPSTEAPKAELPEEELTKLTEDLRSSEGDHHFPIAAMRGKPGGPIECYRGDVRWWSPDGKEWRLATEADVYPDDVVQAEGIEAGGAEPATEVEPAAFEDDGSQSFEDGAADGASIEDQEQAEGGALLDGHLDDMKGTGAPPIVDGGETFDGETGEQLEDQAPTTSQPTLKPTEPEVPAAAEAAPAEEQQPEEPTEEQIAFWRDQGVKARKDGFAPGKSSYAKDTPAWTHWQAGYAEEKKRERDAEQKGAK